jgi:DNA modification methylase
VDAIHSKTGGEIMTVELFMGDCLEYMKSMPAGSVDAVITDPPYGIGYQSARRIDNVRHKYYIRHCFENSENDIMNTTRRDAMSKLFEMMDLLSNLQESLAKVINRYHSDWAEAVAAQGEHPNEVFPWMENEPIPDTRSEVLP